MTGTPSKYGKAQRAVMCVSHPELTASDKQLLSFLASYWPNIWPSRKAIAACLGMSERTAQRQIAKVIRLELLQCTNAGRIGRGVAPHYRICFEHSAFPDVSPSGERLSPEKEDKNPDEMSPFPDQKGDKLEPETTERKTESEKRETDFPENQIIGDKTPSICPPKPFLQADLPSQPSKPTANVQNDKADADPLVGWDGFISKLTTTTALPIPAGWEDAKLKALARKEPLAFEYVKKAVRDFSERSFVGLRISPWALFLKDADRLLTIAKTKCLEDDQWRMDHDPAYKAAIEESIKKQQADDWARMNHEPERDNEVSIEDFLR